MSPQNRSGKRIIRMNLKQIIESKRMFQSKVNALRTYRTGWHISFLALIPYELTKLTLSKTLSIQMVINLQISCKMSSHTYHFSWLLSSQLYFLVLSKSLIKIFKLQQNKFLFSLPSNVMYMFYLFIYLGLYNVFVNI